ncbi:MAG: hypothetical protein FJ265_03480 [Planctomycetes bacterium]|nr:hypothetical protein [Planctomycetota bacterium]
MPRFVRAVLGALFFVPAAVAQGVGQAPSPRVLPAPPSLLQQFDVMAGTVQNLTVPANLPPQVRIDVVFAGRQVQLDLRQFEVRAPGFQLIERSATGEVVLPTPPCVTYRGTVPGDAGSEVAASLLDGSLRAWTRLGSGELWLVQPVREVQPTAGAAVHVVYRGPDSSNLDYHCGVPGTVQGAVPNVVGEDTLYGCQLAIEADYPFFQLNGSSTTATQNDVTSVVNAMDVIYRRDVQIALQVSTLIVNSTTDPYTTNVATTLLNQFASYWNTYRSGVTRDTAHLLSGRPIGAASGGTIGLAVLGVVCNVANAYGLSQSRFSTNWNYRVGVTAHEIGHNFDALHCDSAPPCNIMCSGVGGCANNQTSFSAGEQAQIIAYRQSVGCLTVVPTVPVITTISPALVKTFRPPLVTITGSGLTGTTSVTVGGQAVTQGISVVSDTQLRFTPPHGLPLGVQTVRVTNATGTSNPSNLFYTATNPCELSVPTAVIGGNTLTWQMGGWPADPGYLLLSLMSTTSPVQGWPVLDGYSILWVGGLDARGMASYSVPVPPMVLNGLRVYSQLLDVDPHAIAIRSTSAVASTLVFL